LDTISYYSYSHYSSSGAGIALSLGVERPGREADHSPPSSAKIKNEWGYNSTPQIPLHGVVLSKAKHRDNFTFFFTILIPLLGVYLLVLLCH